MDERGDAGAVADDRELALAHGRDEPVVLRVDLGAAGGRRELRGAATVAGQALGCSRLDLIVRPVLINGAAGAVSTRDGKLFSIGGFTISGGKIVSMDLLADPARLRALDLSVLED